MNTLVAKAIQPPSRAWEDETIRLMSRNRILHCLRPEDLRTLVRQSTLLGFREREPVFSQGEEGRSVMVVLDGFIKLSACTVGGREVVLELVGPGRVFGELAVLNGWRRAADAQTLSPAQLLSIDARLFTQTLARVPEAMFGLLRVLSRRLRRTTEQVADVVDLPGPQRLAKALIKLAALSSHPVGGGLQIDVQLSQRELGAMTGLTRESINKHLSAWRDEGLIRISYRNITLMDPPSIKRRARELAREERAIGFG